jgi:hypothetical protein
MQRFVSNVCNLIRQVKKAFPLNAVHKFCRAQFDPNQLPSVFFYLQPVRKYSARKPSAYSSMQLIKLQS